VSPQNSVPYFSILRKLNHDSDYNVTVRSDITGFPFLRFFFGEKFSFDSREAFLKKAEDEYKAGRISKIDFELLKAMKKLSILFKVNITNITVSLIMGIVTAVQQKKQDAVINQDPSFPRPAEIR
jgi:hypothetical protein